MHELEHIRGVTYQYACVGERDREIDGGIDREGEIERGRIVYVPPLQPLARPCPGAQLRKDCLPSITSGPVKPLYVYVCMIVSIA